MAGVPWASCGMGQPVHGMPVSRPHNMRFKRRGEPSWSCGPRVGLERCGKLQVVHAGAESWTGLGVVAWFFACVGRVPWPRVQIGACLRRNQVFLDTTKV